ncbi:MAG: hypothetical protein CTY29_11650 [Methylobacter sp.]|nr:MAG: hypothetical protein CTY29_11650 [Methylobacter sp.]
MDSSAIEARSLYAGSVLPEISQLLEEAMRSYHDTDHAENLLNKAHQQAPSALPVYFSYYKFLFYKGRLAEAEGMVRAGLDEAARQGGFTASWEQLTPETADWLAHDSPQHFYLFSLKALAFIRLRQGDQSECGQILGKLRLLDPADTVGASVIGALASGI